ncbi:hypothetical protein DFS34DRAFT_625114 [Phlyctochytrium arcticum]|nr:hypothetical protein DFS34DRAFT_625114 [Phlyctochytrium arcticum]
MSSDKPKLPPSKGSKPVLRRSRANSDAEKKIGLAAVSGLQEPVVGGGSASASQRNSRQGSIYQESEGGRDSVISSTSNYGRSSTTGVGLGLSTAQHGILAFSTLARQLSVDNALIRTNSSDSLIPGAPGLPPLPRLSTHDGVMHVPRGDSSCHPSPLRNKTNVDVSQELDEYPDPDLDDDDTHQSVESPLVITRSMLGSRKQSAVEETGELSAEQKARVAQWIGGVASNLPDTADGFQPQVIEVGTEEIGPVDQVQILVVTDQTVEPLSADMAAQTLSNVEELNRPTQRGIEKGSEARHHPDVIKNPAESHTQQVSDWVSQTMGKDDIALTPSSSGGLPSPVTALGTVNDSADGNARRVTSRNISQASISQPYAPSSTLGEPPETGVRPKLPSYGGSDSESNDDPLLEEINRLHQSIQAAEEEPLLGIRHRRSKSNVNRPRTCWSCILSTFQLFRCCPRMDMEDDDLEDGF